MKRILMTTLALLLVLSTAVTAFAATSVSASLSASKKSPTPGEKVTITVSATVDSCGSGGVDISFDSSAFELVSGQWSLSGTFMKDFSTSSKDGVFAFESAKKVSGKVFKFVLKVKDDAALGKETVTVKFKADSKSVTKNITITVSCDHTYDNKCDTTCNKCKATRSITHSWDGGKAIQQATCKAEGSAKYTCKVCGETKTDKVKKTAHTYDNNCDTDCNVCGATRKIEHAYKWNCDADNHWQECRYCGLTQEKQSHTMETEASYNATHHGIACSVCKLIPGGETHVFDSSCDEDCAQCGYVRNVQHVYSERYSYDEKEHWYGCILCGEALEKFAHTPGAAATEEKDQLCEDCGFIIEAAGSHIHSMGGDWLTDDNGHWYQCRCLEFTEPEPHTWDEGTVDEQQGIVTYRCTVCGHFKAELAAPVTEPTDPEPTVTPEPVNEELTVKGIPVWMLAAGGLGVSLLLNIILIVSTCVWRKRAKKYQWDE